MSKIQLLEKKVVSSIMTGGAKGFEKRKIVNAYYLFQRIEDDERLLDITYDNKLLYRDNYSTENEEISISMILLNEEQEINFGFLTLRREYINDTWEIKHSIETEYLKV